jgi:drug/metabolite transporter (DMT)-like permease
VAKASPTELRSRPYCTEPSQPSSSTSLPPVELITALHELPGTRAVLAVIVLGLGCTALGYMLYYWLMITLG